jgi:hypothetical protein
MADLMLRSAVLAHLNAGVRAAFGPDPVVTTWCAHPAYRIKWFLVCTCTSTRSRQFLERALARFGQLLQQGRALNNTAEASDQYVKSALSTVLPHYQQHWSQYRLEVPRANRRWE